MNIVRDYTDLVYENYGTFLKDHDEYFASPARGMELLATEGSFNAYCGALTDGMSKDSSYAVNQVLRRERQMLLQESATGQIASSAQAIGYAVSYFPILADIYSDPVISQIATVYPVNRSILSIPRVRLYASTVQADGTLSNPVKMPRTENLIRQKAMNLLLSGGSASAFGWTTITPGIAPNSVTDTAGKTSAFPVPNAATNFPGISTASSRINKRYFYFSNILVALTDTTANTTTHLNVPVMIRPDARGQLKDSFQWTPTGAATPIICNLYGNVDWDGGSITYTINSNPPTIAGFTFSYQVIASCMYSPTTSDVGRVKVQLKMEGFDVDVD